MPKRRTNKNIRRKRVKTRRKGRRIKNYKGGVSIHKSLDDFDAELNSITEEVDRLMNDIDNIDDTIKNNPDINQEDLEKLEKAKKTINNQLAEFTPIVNQIMEKINYLLSIM